MTDELFADFEDIIGMCDTEVEVRRTEPGVLIDGVNKKDPTPEVFTATGSWQPAKYEDIQRLPEGLRTAEVFAFFTVCDLRVGDTRAKNVVADIVCNDGKLYEVSSVRDWKGVGNFRKYLCVGVAP